MIEVTPTQIDQISDKRSEIESSAWTTPKKEDVWVSRHDLSSEILDEWRDHVKIPDQFNDFRRTEREGAIITNDGQPTGSMILNDARWETIERLLSLIDHPFELTSFLSFTEIESDLPIEETPTSEKTIDPKMDVLYLLSKPFMIKTFEAIDRDHWDSRYLPTSMNTRDVDTTIDEADVDQIGDVDQNVWNLSPQVVVTNHEILVQRYNYHDLIPTVLMHHGATVADREELSDDVRHGFELCDLYLAPGEEWRRQMNISTRIEVIGIPEADRFTSLDPPERKNVLFAPTNMEWGEGCLNRVGLDVIESFAHSEWELAFRPHPNDVYRNDDSIVEEAERKIESIDNIYLDDDRTPGEAIINSDILITDDSGIMTEWLHTRRPIIQITDIESDRDIRTLGVKIDEVPDVSLLDRLYDEGYHFWEQNQIDLTLSSLGIPMDGRASDRARDHIDLFR